jgi:2-polyprenyl-6-methoxyphenol hydroxylase-like FAD-dependent oxidoreductase
MQEQFAFTAKYWGDAAVVCRAGEDRSGPVVEQQFGEFETWTQARTFAARLNEGLEIQPGEVQQIVTSAILHTNDVLREIDVSERARDSVSAVEIARSVRVRFLLADAAHTMSPVGGVGINLAVQDAVATANLLAGKLRDSTLTDSDVEQVQARREWPAKLVQSFQGMVQRRILAPVLQGKTSETEVPLPVRLMSSSEWTQGLAAKFIGLGVRQERVAPAISAGTG